MIASLDVVPVLLFVQRRALLTLAAARVMGVLVQLPSATSARAVSAELPLGSHPQCVALWWGWET